MTTAEAIDQNELLLETEVDREWRAMMEDVYAWEENERLAALRRRDHNESYRREFHYQQNKQLAEHWAAQIRQAFLDRRPCPIIAEPRFQWILQWAFEIAQVPAECLPQRKEPLQLTS